MSGCPHAKRALHGVPNLQWDSSLASGAGDWALYLAKKTRVVLEHSTGSYGENIYYKGEWPAGKVSNCEAAVGSWYAEIKDYDYNRPGFSSNTAHFTQVVWKSTTKVGVGIAAVTRNGFTYTFVVARYSPPGNMNMPGYFAANVPRLV
ncbi:protein PRY1-like [Actinia tenebrosa]|uniref:Protein PRY1-like n=1 Tax=Actinia tenebrosa TaxID=6105 RepID=A0A6P8IE96_ACTTE|nr:protein PRY1-like [Actinia tenebrosa]